MLKASIKIPAGKRKFTPPSFGKDVNGNAVKMLL